MMEDRNNEASSRSREPGEGPEAPAYENTDSSNIPVELLESESTVTPAPPPGTLEGHAAKAAENWDKFLRATADLENFKKRVARERIEQAKFAQAPLLQSLIPILDNLDMAMGAAETSKAESASSLRQGVAMVFQQLKSALQAAGLQEIDATGQAFDPNLHEAVSQVETHHAPEGIVVQQLRKGYKLHDRLLRPASVVVAVKPSAKKQAQESGSDPAGRAQS